MSSAKTKVSATALIVLFLAILYSYYYTEEPDINIQSLSEDQKISVMSTRISVFVLGATGEVGKEVVKELAKQNQIERVTLIGRRAINLPTTDQTYNYTKFTQTIVDFDKLASDHASAFEGFNTGISTLGTTRGKSGKDGFYKVDHDYVVESAKLAKLGGCKHFNLVSSASANKNSYIFYSKVKGETEAEITEMGFDRLTIYRPGLLLCDRTEPRAMEKASIFVFKYLDHWRKLSVETSIVGKAIVNACVQNTYKDKVEILDNGGINLLGKEKEQLE